MTHVSIVVPQADAVLNSIVRIFKIFHWVNFYSTSNNMAPLFDVHLVGITTHSALYGGLFSVKPDLTLMDASETDLIIIPALAGNIAEGLKNSSAYIPWLTEQYKKGTEIASLCTGAFLLAATGLIDGKKCTTHWFVAAEFRRAFSQINGVVETIVIDDQSIYTSGGAYSYIHLLMEKLAGSEVAAACAKIFEIDFNQECQSVFTIFNGEKEDAYGAAKKLGNMVEKNLREIISVERFAAMFSLNPSNLETSFIQATTNTFEQYMENVKVKGAEEDVANGCENVKEIMSKVGYSNSKAFRHLFRKLTGL